MALPRLVAFDLDGTLAPSKGETPQAVLDALVDLCRRVERVAVITGGCRRQLTRQLWGALPPWLTNVVYMPCSGAECLVDRADGRGLTHLWWDALPEEEVDRIQGHMLQVRGAVCAPGGMVWSPLVDRRGGQVTLSLLGQGAPLGAKEAMPREWQARALEMLVELLGDEYSVRAGGLTSVDVTLKGLDKGSSMLRLCETLGLEVADVLFIGDRLDPGGNDRPVMDAGFRCVPTSGPDQTVDIIRGLLVP